MAFEEEIGDSPPSLLLSVVMLWGFSVVGFEVVGLGCFD
jgi:hypothetical protein